MYLTPGWRWYPPGYEGSSANIFRMRVMPSLRTILGFAAALYPEMNTLASTRSIVLYGNPAMASARV